MMIRGAGRKVPTSLFRLYFSASSVAGRSNSPLFTFASSGEAEQQQKGERSPFPAGIVTRSGVSGFSRGFATDALSPTHDQLPPTVAALKNPTNEIVYDEVVHERYPPGDPSKRAFTYFVLTGGRFIYAATLRLFLLKFILSMSASRDVLAMASLEVDLGSIEPGATVTVKWRGKPVFIRHRTEDDIKLANTVNLHELRDPEPDSDRVQNPEWLIVVGVCTHLGCVPLPNAGDYGGWFCPCHGSHYDISGRARKGPAPYNLEVPTYKFLEEGKLLIG
jgi:ubiquinol-cytochrome c reductase iron-sulfur subunit